MATVSLAVQSRQRLGKSVRAGRRAGIVPANIVSKGQPSRAIEIDARRLSKALQQAGYTQPVELEIDQKDKLMALITNVQFQPAKRVCQHVVFQEVHRGEQVTVNVPVVLDGDPPGLTAGWLLLQTIYDLEVTAGALSLPEQITVDVSGLDLENQVIRVGSLKLPDGVTTSVDSEAPVVRLEQSRAAVSAADEADEADAEAEGESETGTDTESAADNSKDSDSESGS